MIKANRLFILIASLIIIHFISTFLVIRHMSYEIGKQISQAIADGFEEAWKNEEMTDEAREKEAQRIYKGIEGKRDNVINKWRTIGLIVSFPLYNLLDPIWKQTDKDYLNDLRSSKESHEKVMKQMMRRAEIRLTVKCGINSLAFGFLIYLCVKLFSSIPLKINPNEHNPAER